MDMDETHSAHVPGDSLHGYRLAYPNHADMDLRIFRAFCAGRTAEYIKSETPCDAVTLDQSLGRVEDYLHSAHLQDIAVLFRSLLSGPFFEVSVPTPVLETLYHAYAESGLLDPEATRRNFDRLHELTDGLPFTTIDDLITTVCQLCDKHERAGFLKGVRVGYRLNTELHL